MGCQVDASQSNNREKEHWLNTLRTFVEHLKILNVITPFRTPKTPGKVTLVPYGYYDQRQTSG